MQDYFNKFLENITLTSKQSDDAKTKYVGVCETLHKDFYRSDYDGSTKFLFGSYKKKTAIRPIIPEQDVDVLFKVPSEVFEAYMSQEHGQSNLLTRVKKVLKDTYSTTDKIKNWGKVVLVEFSEGRHNVEILPARENDNGTFTIPNTENGGSWDEFDVKPEIANFEASNDKTDGLTRDLIKMIKKWERENKTLSIKSYIIDKALD